MMKKLAALLPLALLTSCMYMYTSRPIKIVEGKVINRQVFHGRYWGRDYSEHYITLFTVMDGSEIFYIGWPGVEGDTIKGCTVEKDSIKAIFGENPEVIHKKGKLEFLLPETLERTYDSPFTVP
jgi:hypothetical protein